MLHNTFFVQAKHLKHLCAYGTILHNMALDKTKQLVISQYSLLLDYHNHSLQPGNLEDLYLSVVLSRTLIKTNYVHSLKFCIHATKTRSLLQLQAGIWPSHLLVI